MATRLVLLGGVSLAKSFATPLIVSLVLLFPGLSIRAHAQVTQTIGPGSLGTQVNQIGNVYEITQGTRAGSNLFHSFGNFSLSSVETARFQNTNLVPDTTIGNILGRVTGGNPSSIFGTIDSVSYYPGANLFLMNPAGIVFGPNAVINVGGMAHFTTANYLRLDDVGGQNAGIFHADLAQASVLTTAPVTAFGFLGSNPATIAVQGSQLTMAEGTGISLIGGNRGFTYTNPDTSAQASAPDGVTVTGGARISAPNGEINLAVTASPGEFLVAGLQPAPNINSESFTSYGSVHLAPGSTIDVSGTNTVSIRGGQFMLSINDAALSTAGSYGPADTISLSPGSSIVSLNAGAEPGADVQIVAATLRLDGASIQTLVTGDGQGGNISLGGQNIVITNGAQVVTSTEGPGNGGAIAVSGSESVVIEGFVPYDGASRITNPLLVNVDTGEPLIGSGLFSNSAASGAGGAINLTAPAIRLDNGGTLMTVTSGDGAGGNILVNANTITATSASMLFSSSGLNYTTFEFAGNGRGGDIMLNASQSILLSGGNLNVFALTTAFTQALSEGAGGNISLTAPDIMVFDGASLSTQTGGAGTAGFIHVSAPHLLTVSGLNADFGVGSTITSSTFGGNGGAVALNAGTVVIQDGGSVGTNSAADGNAGNISIVAGDIFVRQGLISTSASSTGATGTINVSASGTVSISEPFDAGFPVAIYAHQEGSGARGDIHISGHDVLLTSGAEINSTAANSAQTGGSIAIDAVDSIEISNGGGVRTFGGAAGNPDVTLSAPHVTLNQGLLSSRTFSSQNGGTITVSGEDITVTNGSQILTATQLGASGNAGSILLQANDIAVSGGSLINSSVNSPTTTGQGGIIALEAQNGLTLTGTGTQVLAATEGIGAGGSILLASNLITVSDGAVVSASSTHSGAAGSVTIQGNRPAQSVLIDGFGSGISTNTEGTGAGGNININANSVTLQNSGTLSATTSGTGNAGNISVSADQVSLTNFSRMTTSTSGQGSGGTIHVSAADTIRLTDSFISASSNSTGSDAGSGGQITLRAPTLNVVGGNISTLTLGSGNAGNIQIQAGTFSLGASEGASGLVQATTSGPGHGGNISIVGLTGPGSPANDVMLSGFSSIRSETLTNQGGTAGNIAIETMQLALTEGSAITTASRLNSPGNAGNVTLNATESILVSGSYVTSDVLEGSTGNGGQVTIKTPNLTVNQSSEGFGGLISTSTSSSGSAGTVTINANNLTLTEGGRLASRSFLDDPIYPPATGAAGAVVVQGMTGAGSRANSIVINGQDGSGNVSGIFTNTEGSGRGGNMTLFANSVTLQNGGVLSAKTSGSDTNAVGGMVTVNTEQMVMSNHALVTAETTGVAPAGVVEINTGSLAINSGSQIRSSSGATVPPVVLALAPPLTGGTVSVQGRTGAGSLADSVAITGTGSGIFTGTEGARPGGDLNISAQSVSISNGALVTAATTGTGTGGAVTINAGNTFASNAGTVSSTASQAQGGDIMITAGNSVTLSNHSLISANSTGPGNAGNILINAGQNYTSTDSAVTTQATAPGTNASGGNITVLASDQVQLTNSQLNASVRGSSTTVGGNIVIDPTYVILQNSQIIAQAFQGQGGNISITTNFFLPDSVSIVNASSQFGVNGTVNIQSPLSQLGGKLSPLPKNSLESTTWINSRCRALADGQASSFVVAGRDMLPAEPGGWLGSSVTGLTGEPVLSTHVPSFPQIHKAPSQEDTVSLRRMTPPGFLLQAFATDRLADCTS